MKIWGGKCMLLASATFWTIHRKSRSFGETADLDFARPRRRRSYRYSLISFRFALRFDTVYGARVNGMTANTRIAGQPITIYAAAVPAALVLHPWARSC